ncbi:unnamed protein product [Mytilus edulis]|uniref:Uncharacterized protein n=1 Tax=Mytilus edulis TaxID=6550 RepID=A0A8S3QIH4_MYTED|nr:unnamed protein product [Mytilus edulis]
MEPEKGKRAANFTEAEKVFLTELVERNINNSKFKSTITNQRKKTGMGRHCQAIEFQGWDRELPIKSRKSGGSRILDENLPMPSGFQFMVEGCPLAVPTNWYKNTIQHQKERSAICFENDGGLVPFPGAVWDKKRRFCLLQNPIMWSDDKC